jgi:hypothetical protein
VTSVLLVDDDPSVLEIVEMVLVGPGLLRAAAGPAGFGPARC